ncbi:MULTISPECIES: helicase-exonuclease AddAB subunit AddA [unclassified Facklamia]|uniref:helicase-exonuclease AddAB subunit AddA n=1 Tax=Aerococcaceae TaxID=186827 RepID=UPI0013BB500F|nr:MULTISPECIES: helicase-exonuclease AddAB subunit AddA [unclassified Facklamia]NEW63556.1 helicase-exonuclease AddAB subunit AddA [Facklamia sp. 252]NEW67027.1 helicase-exonuclease AddAB subunit AddA [Facklamia sp. 253]QQD66424.1 helicase-exonuclease AddAB subunit AddA [Aerococcaceae bacterium zg-252]
MIEPKPLNSTFNDEQWQAIQQTGSNLLVAASAGSGKTTVLIERILTHIKKQYAEIDELLVVTFTESAANEMKERMESKLKEAIKDGLQPETQRLLLNQIQKLPLAHIRTLHSFCLQVIQQFFYLIDFNPSFSLLTDETQKQLMYQEVWEQVLSDILTGKVNDLSPEILRDLMRRYSNPRDDKGLYQLVLDLHHFSSSHPEPMIWLENLANNSLDFEHFGKSDLYAKHLKPSLESSAQTAYQLLETALNQLQGASDEIQQKYVATLSQEQNQVAQLLEAIYQGQLDVLSHAIGVIEFKKWPTKPRKTEEGELIDSIKSLRDQAKERVVKQLSGIIRLDYAHYTETEQKIAPIIEQLGKLTRLFKNQLTHHKRSKNLIDYNDLEHLTLDILAPYNESTKRREASIAASYYQELFKEVLVDEYQDINEIQATILAWLSHEHRDDLLGNLFMVGDVKQSIYGFRMAEPSLFMEKYRHYQNHNGGELIVLDKNYRSRDEVLQFTNFIFERLMDEQFGEMPYAEKEALKTGNWSFIPEAPHADFNIELLLHEKDSDEEDLTEDDADNPFDASVEAQAHLIAQDILGKIERGTMIYDKQLKVERPLEFRDIVLLTSTRGPFLAVQQAFQQYQIPINAQKVDTYFQRQEVQLMLALLKLIDNPRQDLPLVAILRSFFVGLDDEALSKIRIEQKNGSYYDACIHYLSMQENEISQSLQDFFKKLTHWQNQANERRLVELIWLIYQETYFLDYVGGLSNGKQRQANLHALYEYAANFEQSSFKGVFGFVRYIEEVTQHQQDLAEPVLLSDDQNFVRMMTVHASKGLEFPVVYLMNLNKSFNMQDVNQKRYLLSKHFGLGTDLYDYEQLLRYPSLVKAAMKVEKSLLLKAEEMRKLYVALTRCEQQLILVGSIKNQVTWQEQTDLTRELTSTQQKQIALQERQQARSWLDWIRQALAVSDTLEKQVAQFKIDQVTTKFFATALIEERRRRMTTQQTSLDTNQWLEHTLQAIENISSEGTVDSPLLTLMDELANPQYAYRLASNTSSYQSVSELKRMYEEPSHQQLSHFEDRSITKVTAKSVEDSSAHKIQSIRYTQDTFEPPRFMQEKVMSYAEIGTLTHFVMQHLNFSSISEPLVEWVQSELERMVSEDLLSDEQRKMIQLDKIARFLASDAGQALVKYTASVKREQAFSYLLPAHWLFKAQLTDETIHQLADNQLLIHGVIDTYYETEKGIVLLDYKTDRYRPYGTQTRTEQIATIVEKYKFQISLYTKALTVATGKPVVSASLVLLDFDEVYTYDELYQFEQ